MKVSVALAAYNGERYVRQQLETIIHQSRIPDEIIIVDDNSSDNTADIIDKYMLQNADILNKIKFIFIRSKLNRGFIENFRYIVGMCTGDIIFTCDQDDIWEYDKIEQMTECFEKDNSVKLVASSLKFVNSEGVVIDKSYIPYGIDAANNVMTNIALDKIIEKNYFPGCTMAIKKEIVAKYLELKNVNIPHDWSMAMIAAAEGGLYWLNRVLIKYRIHDNNTLGLAAAGSKIYYIKRTLSTWGQYCIDLRKRVEFVRKELNIDNLMYDYIKYMDIFTCMRMNVIQGHKPFRSYMNEIQIYLYRLTGKIDKKGLIIDFIYIFIRKGNQ